MSPKFILYMHVKFDSIDIVWIGMNCIIFATKKKQIKNQIAQSLFGKCIWFLSGFGMKRGISGE